AVVPGVALLAGVGEALLVSFVAVLAARLVRAPVADERPEVVRCGFRVESDGGEAGVADGGIDAVCDGPTPGDPVRAVARGSRVLVRWGALFEGVAEGAHLSGRDPRVVRGLEGLAAQCLGCLRPSLLDGRLPLAPLLFLLSPLLGQVLLLAAARLLPGLL